MILFGQFDEWPGNVAVILDKSPVEIAEAQKTLYLANCCGSGPVADSLELDGIHHHLSWADDCAEKLDFWDSELTFFCFEEQVVSCQSFHHSCGVLL